MRDNPGGGELDPVEGVRRRCNVLPPQRGVAVPAILRVVDRNGEATSQRGPTIRSTPIVFAMVGCNFF